MKKIIIFSGLIILTKFGNAQFALLATVNDISSYANASTTSLFVSDTLRGGQFYKYAGRDAVDNGMIFIDALGNKWLRRTDGSGTINSHWYGIRNAVRGFTDDQNDMWDKMMAAQNYIWKHNKSFTTLFIPEDYSGFGYIFMSKPDTIKNPIIIAGMGSYGSPYSSFEWYNQTTGFYVPASQENGDGNLFGLKNLRLTQYIKSYADTVHLIVVRCKFNFENIDIKTASGDGIHVLATSYKGGNASQSYMTHVQVTDCNNGVYIEGADANIISSYTCSYVSNRRWGYWDNSLLGTSNYSGHWSNNGKVAHHETVVQYPPGKYWRCLSDTGITGKRPDLYPALWQQVTAMGEGVWDASKKYFSGGAYYCKNINARTTFYSPYTESFQPPGILNQSSHSIDGDQGAEVNDNEGILENVFGSQKIISGNLTIPPSVITPKISRRIWLGTSSGRTDALITAYVNTVATGVTDALAMQSDASAIWIRAINSSSNNGYFGYAANTWVAYAGGVSVHTTSPTEFRPSFNNATDLGSSSYTWKNIYGNKLNINTGSNASLGVGNLGSGKAMISTTSVSASSKIFVTLSNCNNCGTIYLGTITPGRSFVVNSTNAADNSSFNWWIVN